MKLPDTTSSADDIVISGISGRFPESDSVEEFWNNLINSNDMTSADDRRWPVGILGLPPRSGKIRDIDKMDAEFFKVSDYDANYMDVQIRILHEVTYEAIWDAGIDPDTLRGSRTGVLVGKCYDDTSKGLAEDPVKTPACRQMSAAQIAFAFDFRGPAFETDTACASSLSCLHEGLNLMKVRQVENLIIAGAACHLTPETARTFTEMKMISPDGLSKCLDFRANGYCRSEAVVSIFIQRRSSAKRIYATILTCKTNCDGYKNEGITFPGYQTQRALLKETIQSANVDASKISYIEAHLTGTAVGDPVECRAIMDSYRVNSNQPLLFGCLKSNIGHTEGASSNCGITKVALIFQNHKIPANRNYENPNPNIAGLTSGIIIPITEQQEFHDTIVPINAFGFGGVNVHTILKANEKSVEKDSFLSGDKIPRLVNICGRTKESVEHALTWIEDKQESLTKGFLSLLNDVSKVSLESGMPYRGSMIIKGNCNTIKSIAGPLKETGPLWFVFSPLGSQWKQMAKELLRLDFMGKTLLKLAKITKNLGIDLMMEIVEEASSIEEDITAALVSIVSFQLTLVDFLKYLGISPSGIIGHSIGEVGAGYADGCLTAEEAITIAYNIAECGKAAQKGKGLMVATDLSWEEAVEKCPEGVYPACDNAAQGVTLAGEEHKSRILAQALEAENRFAREVASCQMAFHCPMVKDAFLPLTTKLERVIKAPKRRTTSWICTSQTELQKQEGLSDYCNAFYYANNVVSPVYFQEALKHIPHNACIVEIGPHALLSSILRSAMVQSMFLACLVNKKAPCQVSAILSGLGQIYLAGHNPKIENIYPPVEYPVERETPCLSQLIKWDHSKKWFVTKFPEYFSRYKATEKYNVDLIKTSTKFLSDHCIDGRVLFPATGYLYIVWKKLAISEDSTFEDAPIEFRQVQFLRATLVPKVGSLLFNIEICHKSGRFQVSEGGSICVSGYVKINQEVDLEDFEIGNPEDTSAIKLTKNEIYKELRIRGYDYGPKFQGLEEAYSDGSEGKVKWTGHWVSFVDSLFQVAILGQKSDFRSLFIPTSIEYLNFDLKKFNAKLNSLDGAEPIFKVRNDSICEIIITDGLVVKHLTTTPIQRRQNTQTATLEKHVFLPHDEDITSEVNYPHEYAKLCEEQLKTLATITAATNEHKEISEDNKGCTGLLNALEKAVAQNLKGSALKEYLLLEKGNLIKDPLLNAPLSRLLRPIMDTILENVHSSSMKIVEVVKSGQPGSASIIESLDSLASVYQYSIVCPETSLFKNQSVDSLIEWNVDESTIPLQLTQCDAIILKDISFGFLEKETSFNLLDFLTSCLNALKDEGFLVILIKNKSLTVEDLVCKVLEEDGQPLLEQTKAISDAENAGFTLIGIKNYSKLFSAIFLRKSATTTKNNVVLELETEKYDWVPKLQEILKADENNQVWLKSKTEAGVGFVRCLRKEQHGRRVRCVVQNEDLDLKDLALNSIESSIIKKNLSVNIYNGKKLGTNRHLTFSPDETIIDTKHAYLDIKSKGDLTSLEWREAPHKFWDSLPASSKPSNQFLCNIYYSALNFKDVMVASGRIPLNAYPEGLRKGCAIGMEYSGIDENGRRIFGLCNSQAIATTLLIHKDGFHFQVPNEWTLEEASTVSTVYLTVYYALILRANLRAGETVLIHAGSGGVGQAAIQVCLSLGCKVYTTVGSEEKKMFLQQRFPQLKDQHFANSRELNFEEHMMRETNGKGVDVILNSLAEEKMRASINCLRSFGRFVEIGKYDLIQNNPMHPSFLTDNKTFHVICLAHLMHEAFILKSQRAIYRCDKLKEIFTRGLQTGQVTPLPTKTFHRHEAEKAFRYMASGKHIGKVVISIRDEHQPSMDLTVKAYAQTWCHPLKSYIIVGGLGGFGLELANWLFTRGAKNIVLSSRSGMKDNFQKLSVERLKSQGVNVIVCTKDASTYEGAVELIEEATKQAPLGGIFNLAMVLKDGFFENQTVDNFEQVCRPKVATTVHLDRITRSKCPQLDYFVCFSSVAAGRGSPGQTNYGFANSFMESVCLKRRNDGLHGLAIQWGPVGDVGVVAETMGNEVNLLGTVPQRIPYCFEVMNYFLQSKESVCSSVVRTDRKRSAGNKKQSLVETICHILGVKEYITLAPTTTLGDLGLDSLMAVEIKQGLERDYDHSLSTDEIRRLSFTDLEDIASKTY